MSTPVPPQKRATPSPTSASPPPTPPSWRLRRIRRGRGTAPRLFFYVNSASSVSSALNLLPSMRPRKMLVHHSPFLPLFCKHMRAPPVDLVPSPELHAPIKRRHRHPAVHRHVRLLHVVRELRCLLQVVVKRLAQRPQPANPLVLRRRKPHEPAVKQFQRAQYVPPVDRPHLFPFQLQNFPTHALRHGSPPISRSAMRSQPDTTPVVSWPDFRPLLFLVPP